VWQSPANLESWIGGGPPARQGGAQQRTTLVNAAAEARTALHEAARAAAEAATRARTVADELDAVLASLREQECGLTIESRPGKPIAPEGAASLSPREQEVLALVAEGRTNKAIAEALYVSPNTVKTHVASLLTKLDAHTRVQLATMAAQYGWHRA
jgi:DNA-binding NarL/FixJ family response regulator